MTQTILVVSQTAKSVHLRCSDGETFHEIGM